MNKILFSPLPESSLSQNLKKQTVFSTNVDILIALMPSVFWAVHVYGARAFMHFFLAIVSAVFSEVLISLALKRPAFAFLDLSSVVYSLICVMLLPAALPVYFSVLMGFAVVLAKRSVPALRALAFSPAALVLSASVLFAKEKMYSFPNVSKLSVSGEIRGGATYAITPLINGTTPDVPWYEWLFGNAPGPMGTVSLILVAAGGIYLLVRKTAKAKIVFAFLAGVAVTSYLVSKSANAFENVLYVMMCGQYTFAAFFLAALPGERTTDSRLDILLPLISGALSVYLSFKGILLAVPYSVAAMNVISCAFKFLPPSQPVFGGAGKKKAEQKKPSEKEDTKETE